MIWASLAINVVVLVPICIGLLREAKWSVDVFGKRSPGRQILLAIYASILILSAGLFVVRDERMALGLLLAQIVYKVLTPFTVGTLRHPVVLSNLAIAAFHSVTAYVILTR